MSVASAFTFVPPKKTGNACAEKEENIFRKLERVKTNDFNDCITYHPN